jgi:AraC-like DNA-binding protein
MVLVAETRRILAEAPSKPHRIRDIASTLAVSPFHLAHVFRRHTGVSIHQYVLQLRMAHAAARLAAGETNLSRLAIDLGFSSHSHFSAVFRRYFGASPTAFRASAPGLFASPLIGTLNQRPDHRIPAVMDSDEQ